MHLALLPPDPAVARTRVWRAIIAAVQGLRRRICRNRQWCSQRSLTFSVVA
jgi:hypothetical protein